MRKLVTFILLMILLTGCTRYAYFQSPLHTNTNSYKAIPTNRDKTPSAVYASGAITTGGANDNNRDGFTALIGSLHRSHNWGHFQAYYGLSGTLGRYKVDSVSNGTSLYRNNSMNDSLINARSGSKFFGSWGMVSGINFVWPFRGGGEWRVIGTELSWNQEFGKYLDFRQQLPDRAANLIDKNRRFLTIGVSTDLLLPITNGYLGVKMGGVFNPRSLKGYNKEGFPTTYSSSYFSNTFHLTLSRVTGFLQMNFGTYAVGLQLGANLRLGK